MPAGQCCINCPERATHRCTQCAPCAYFCLCSWSFRSLLHWTRRAFRPSRPSSVVPPPSAPALTSSVLPLLLGCFFYLYRVGDVLISQCGGMILFPSLLEVVSLDRFYSIVKIFYPPWSLYRWLVNPLSIKIEVPGAKVRRVCIQKLSHCFLQAESAVCICSMTIIVRSSNVWPIVLKCFATGLSESFR